MGKHGTCNVGVDPTDPGLPVVGQGRLSAVRKSKRSRWRAGVLIGVHVVVAAHVAHYLAAGTTLSPVEPSESMYTLELGYVNAGFIFFAIALLATLIFGRFFCGWGCHIVALQDFCAWVMKRLGVRPKPFRSRFLAFAPIAVAFYMFALPLVLRLLADGPAASRPPLTNHLLTSDLWATFPGPVFAVLTFVTCGFAAVYFLGAKGFCTYGCPYGAFFGTLDYASPGKIVVNDDCEQCGHCTATCTSNVRVHEEVKLYGMVVDPGCMKCMDCVSVCPKHALRFSFAPPTLAKRASAVRPARRYDLSLGEEVLVAAVAFLATLAFRDLYNGPPLLMSVGLGAISAYLALTLWRLRSRPAVRVQNLELKAGGSILRPGWILAVLTVAWLVFTAHSGFAQWHRAWGRHDLELTEATREEVLGGTYPSKTYSDRHTRAAAGAFRHFSLADRWGLAGVVEVKLGLAWCHLLRGEHALAERKAEEALALAPENAELQRNLADIRAAAPTAENLFLRAGALAAAGRFEEAAVLYERCVTLDPGAGPARYNYGGVLRRLGRSAAAVEQLEAARSLAPDDPDVWIELGLAYMDAGADDDAAETLRRAIVLAPERPEARVQLPELIERIEARRRNAPPPR